MKQKIITLVICFILVFQIPLSGFATLQDIQYVVDNASILSYQEVSELNTIAGQLNKKYDTDVLIMTVLSLNGKSAQAYAESLYDETDTDWNGNYWDSEDAVLFLLAVEEREWYISTGGNAIYIFTDYALDNLGQAVVTYLSEGAFYEGFYSYLNQLPDYFDAYESGSPIDGYAPDHKLDDQTDIAYYNKKEINPMLSIGIGFIAALISVLIMIMSMNTKRRQLSAANYIRSESYHLRNHADLFLYSNVTKVRKQEKSSNGGGSSIHIGSGGTRHGGRGGKF